MSAVSVLAVDIGATKFAAGVVDADGSVLTRSRAAVPQSSDPVEVFGTLLDVIREAMGAHHVDAIGVGTAGPIAQGGKQISPLSIPAWRNFPLHDHLSAATQLPVFIDLDTKALALGERWRGGARGVSNFIAMVVSSGVGGGIVLDGRLLDGRNGNAGHIGHVIVEPEGRLCPCGARGCLEAEASGLSIAAVTGSAPENASLDVMERAGTLVGRGVASVANLLDLQLALVGGSVALGYGEPFFTAAQQELDRRCRLDFSRGMHIEPVHLGSDGGLIGAAAIAFSSTGTPRHPA